MSRLDGRESAAAAPALSINDFDSGWIDDVDVREPPRRRDWKKISLVVGLGALSWVATYIGMLELIESNMGELSLVHRVVVGFSVAMLMVMIIWLLDQMWAPIPSFTKTCYVAGYIFLTLISVGFGFGFYWKVLESRSEASRSAESAIGQVQSSLHAAGARLTQLQETLVQLAALSSEKAVEERNKGTSCPNSRPGDGPRRKLRDDDAARFGFASDFVKGRGSSVRSEMKSLDGDLQKVVKGDKSTIDAVSGTRNDFLRGVGRKLDLIVTGFNAFRTDPQLRQLRTDLAERADKTVFPDTKGGTFACPDAQLQTALRGVVRAIDQLPVLEKPKIAAVEGSEAVIEAFRRLTATFYGALQFRLPPSPEELRALQQKAVQSVETTGSTRRSASIEQAGLSKRDYIPLSIALFVDLCLLLVSIGRPMNRLGGLLPRMQEAERGPVIQILSRFNHIHKDKEIRENFEIFRHVVFDYNGDYYVAVPLDAPVRLNPEQREEMRLEAQLLSNLFTSFEKEKIFTRLDNRVISTFLRLEPGHAIAKRQLARQGSKFSEAPAFRLYKFRDGAWSEIILGAVMGAARRVEQQKRYAKAAAELTARREPSLRMGMIERPAVSGLGITLPFANDDRAFEPTLDVPPARNKPAVAPNEDASVADAFDPDSTSHRPPPAFLRQRPVIDASFAAKFGPHAAGAAREILDPIDELDPPTRDRRSRRSDEAEVELRAPTSSEAVAEPEQSRPVSAEAATATLPSQPKQQPVESAAGAVPAHASLAARLDAAPAIAELVEPTFETGPARAGGDFVSVEVRERSLRYTIPTHEAELPEALRVVDKQAAIARPAVEVVVHTDVELPPPPSPTPQINVPAPKPAPSRIAELLDPMEQGLVAAARRFAPNQRPA